MRARSTFLAVLGAAAILAIATATVVLLLGPGPLVLRGAALGAGLGAAGSVLEASLLLRALALPRGHALGVVLSGFGVRLAILVGGALLLRNGSLADPTAFALSFVGGFLAGIPVTASITASAAGAGPRGVAP